MRSRVLGFLALSAVLMLAHAYECIAEGSLSPDSADSYDAVLLYDPSLSLNSDKMFVEICGYFGLRCKKVDVTNVSVSDSTFLDEQNSPIRVAAISALLLCGSGGLVDSGEVSVLSRQVDSGQLNLLVTDVRPSSRISDFSNLSILTQGEIQGFATPVLSKKNYIISASRPEILREFSGESLVYEEAQADFAVALAGQSPHVTDLVTSLDAFGIPFPVFVTYRNGSGTVFVSSGVEYYDPARFQFITLFNHRYFTGAVLIAIFIRYSGGEECWHRDFDLANFTIDDPPLNFSLGNFSYSGLLEQMTQHHFHTTVAFIPKNFLSSDPGVVSLFLENRGYFSLAQHGNNHDGYEFYRYVVQEGDPFPARPLSQQEMNIVEGMYRMRELERLTGLSSGQIMIFPYASSPQETYSLLKRYNFLATANGSVTGFNLPLDAVAPSCFTFDMYPACLDYENFTAMHRWMPSTGFTPIMFSLFLDKPVLIFEHTSYFTSDIGAFNSLADRVNSLEAKVVWASLGYISEHNWLTKRNDDGTYDIMMLGRRAVIVNPDMEVRTFEVLKREDLRLPILSVKVNGTPRPYVVDTAGLLRVEFVLGPSDSAAVEVSYGQGGIDFAISASDILPGFTPGADSVTVSIHNLGAMPGPVIVQFFNGEQSAGGRLVDYRIVWDESLGTTLVSIPWNWENFGTSLYVRLDPYDFTQELREDNDQASVGVKEEPSNSLRVTGSVPNTFTSSTTISFDIPLPAEGGADTVSSYRAHCRLSIVDISGRIVADLFRGVLTPGKHYLHWEGRNDSGSKVAAGLYLCVLQSGEARFVRKIIYLK